MAEIRKKIGNLPTYKGDYVNKVYNIYQQVSYLGATFQSKIDNNTSVPATLDANGDYIVNANWSMIARGVTDEKVNSVIDSKLEQPLHNIEVAEQGREAAEVIREQKIAEMDKTYATKVELSNEMSGVVKDYKGITCPIDIALNSDVKSISFYLKKKYTTATGYAIKLSSDPSIWNRLGIVNDTNRIVVRGSTTEDFYQLFDNEMPTHIAVVQKDITTCSVYMNGVYVKDVIMTINCIKTIGDDINYYFKLFQIHTFNYTLTQSDVDMLYNQGRCNDVKIGSEWRNAASNKLVNFTNFASNYNGAILTKLDSTTIKVDGIAANDYTGIVNWDNVINAMPSSMYKVSFDIVAMENIRNIFDIYLGSGRKELHSIPSVGRNEFIIKTPSSITPNQFIIRFLVESIALTTSITISNICVEPMIVLDEYTPQNLSPTEWRNSGVNTIPIALTNPQFTFDAPFKEKTFGSGAPTTIPEAALIEYSDVATGNIYKAGAKPNTRQFAVSDWKRINN